MPVQKSKTILDKINLLYERLSNSPASVSNLEKDLMLDLIRQLYDSFLEISVVPKELPAKPEPEIPQTPTPIVPPTPISTPTPPPEPPAPKPVAPQIPERFIPSDTEALFDFKKATELSEKLGEQPVRDLTKALSINDRLLYMNELFGKDLEAMNESLKLLNKLDDFEGSKSFLITLASQYHWLEEDRIDVARDFVRLVRRRYS